MWQLLYSGKFLDTISNRPLTSLCHFNRRSSTYRPSVNPGKGDLVLFTRKYKESIFRLPQLNDVELKLSDRAKYMDTKVNCILSWLQYVKVRATRITIALCICRRAFGKSWRLKHTHGGEIHIFDEICNSVKHDTHVPDNIVLCAPASPLDKKFISSISGKSPIDVFINIRERWVEIFLYTNMEKHFLYSSLLQIATVLKNIQCWYQDLYV